MKKIKSNINLLIAISGMLFSVLGVIIGRLDYIYIPRNYVLFFIVYLVFGSIMTYFSVCYKNYASIISRRTAFFLPLISLVYSFTLLFCFDNILCCELLSAISLISSFVIFFSYNKIKWLEICVAVIAGIFAVPFLNFLFISILFTNFGEIAVIQTETSPDGTYIAQIFSNDQGALGGSTEVCVRNVKEDISLVSGRLITESTNLWSGYWRTEVTLKWKDDDTLVINGKSYDIEHFLSLT